MNKQKKDSNKIIQIIKLENHLMERIKLLIIKQNPNLISENLKMVSRRQEILARIQEYKMKLMKMPSLQTVI